MGISLHRDSDGEFERGSFIGDCDRRTKEGSVNGASLPMGFMGIKIRGRASLIGNLQSTYDM